MSKKVYIRTMGCQMNTYDSFKMQAQLETQGYELCASVEEADLALINTCAVRENVSNKLRSALGRMSKLKEKKPGLIVAIAGCVPATEGERIKARYPSLDILLTPDTINAAGELVKEAENRKGVGVIEAGAENSKFTFPAPGLQPSKIPPVCYVTITKGCNNFCSYCIVPFARGREESRDPEDIMKEIKTLLASGAKEIVLIGQNVNSYTRPDKGFPDFTPLLYEVAKTPGLRRLSFITSHPRDFNERLAKAFADLDNLCPYLHLPPQSGSNRILKAMKRQYTVEEYKEKIHTVRSFRPDIAISGDFIVGFPGETDADFRRTIDLVEEIQYDMLYAFKYSPRPKTSASKLPDDVSPEIKQIRLAQLLSLCNDVTVKRAKTLYTDKQVEVLAEGVSPGNPKRWQGRTRHNKVVNFDNVVGAVAGDFVKVLITSVEAHSLIGKGLIIQN